ncbi:O-antigen ligase family protein [Fulvimarina sp. MAC8]|uniref:O-antigen ligase family protein n=1 Tax=Fulvimarina sp. MAC8 TaxID=3162874 RepID=UPI0032EBC52F
MNPVTSFARLINPPTEGMAERNRPAIILSYAIMPLAGSLVGLIVTVLTCWAAICLVVGRLSWRAFGPAAPLLWSHVAFFGALAVADILNSDPGTAALDIGLRLFFLMPIIAVHRVAISRTEDVLDAVFKGAAIGGILAPVAGLASIILFDSYRAEGFAGNAGPFSILCLLTAGLALLGFREKHDFFRNAIALLGMFGASLAVIMTGMRGAWPALPIILAIALWTRRRDIPVVWSRIGQRHRGLTLAAAFVLTLVGVVLGAEYVSHRAQGLIQDFEVMFANANAATSLSLRSDMYRAGIAAFLERPFLGWGESGLWAAVQPHLGAVFADGFSFSHLHNVILTVGVQAGLVGIAALLAVLFTPIWCAFRQRREAEGPARLAFALILVCAYLIPGLTNIMFFHDILDAVWALSIWTLAGTMMSENGVRSTEDAPA